jgi:hypothetical protein
MKGRSWQWTMAMLMGAGIGALGGWATAQVEVQNPSEVPDSSEAADPSAVDGTEPWFWDGTGPRQIRDPETDVSESIRNSKPFQRWWYRYELMTDPENPLDIAALRLQAWEQLEEMETRGRARPRLRIGTAAVTPAWVNIGPAPITDWIRTGQTASGRLTDIAVNPSDSTRWAIAGANGGVWTTATSGSSWAARTDNQATLSLGAVAYSGNGSVLFAGTGDFVGFGGVGILKSTDGGATWTLYGQSTFAGARFHDIRVNPSNSNIVIAATSIGLYRSTDGAATWPAPLLAGEVTDLEIDPTNFNRQYAGVKKPDNRTLDGVWRSTDEGVTWNRLTGASAPWEGSTGPNVERVEIAIAPSNTNVAYIAAGDPSDGRFLKGLWRTANAWAGAPTWTQIATTATTVTGNVVSSYCAQQCAYDHDLIVKPTDANILFAGGVRLFKYNFGTNVWTDIGRAECPI